MYPPTYDDEHGSGFAGGGRASGHDHPPGQGGVRRSRRHGPAHQTRPGPLLPVGGRGCAARRGRAADDPEALRQGHLRGSNIPEARAQEPARLGGRRRTALRAGHFGRGGRHPRRPRAGMGGQPWLRGPQPTPGAGRRPRPPRRTAGRPRPDARSLLAADRRRGAGGPRGAGGLRPDPVAEDVGVARFPHLRPDRTRWEFRQVRLAAQTVAREVERRMPDAATSRWWKEEREGVFVDFNQNAKDRTVASAYSVRATPDARVSTPLLWDEVTDRLPEEFTIDTVPARFAAMGDPWAGWTTRSVSSTGCWCWARRWGPGAGAEGIRHGRRPAPVGEAPHRDRPHQDQGRGAGRAGHLARPPPGRRSPAATGRRPGRRHARAEFDLVPDPDQPAARAGGSTTAAGRADRRLQPLGRVRGQAEAVALKAATPRPARRRPSCAGSSTR